MYYYYVLLVVPWYVGTRWYHGTMVPWYGTYVRERKKERLFPFLSLSVFSVSCIIVFFWNLNFFLPTCCLSLSQTHTHTLLYYSHHHYVVVVVVIFVVFRPPESCLMR